MSTREPLYDIIGDIHGQYGKLEALLGKLGYSFSHGLWTPPNGRIAVFLGDLIDRGPQQLRTLDAVRAMCEAGLAHCVMGNHELNAIGYVTPYPDEGRTRGMFAREHSNKNRHQHIEFLRQVGEGSDLHAYWIEWFRTLPLYLDLGGIRAVHAWWHQPHIDTLHRHNMHDGRLSDEQVLWALGKHDGQRHEAFDAFEGLSKGLEIRLPEGLTFTDHAGNIRKDARTRWWLEGAEFLHEIAITEGVASPQLNGHPIPTGFNPIPVSGAPVFIGHYWMQGKPAILTPKVACLDYSAAHNGPLVAYRWRGESELSDAGFVEAGAP